MLTVSQRRLTANHPPHLLLTCDELCPSGVFLTKLDVNLSYFSSSFPVTSVRPRVETEVFILCWAVRSQLCSALSTLLEPIFMYHGGCSLRLCG